MNTWLIIVAIFLILIAMKLAKFAGLALIIALFIMLIVKNFKK